MTNKTFKTADFQFHPVCKLFPIMPDDQLQQLADDIVKNGLLEPIVTHEGEILDGRNRLLACEKAGVEPEFVEWDGDSTPAERVISGNLMRRDLTPGQRAMIAADLLPLLKEEAAERQRLSRGRGKKGAKPTSTFKGKASEEAAKMVGVNPRYVEHAQTLNTHSPAIAERVRNGDITIPEAMKMAFGSTQEPATKAENHIGRTTGRNEIATPLPLCQFLHDLIAPIHKVKTILDPCAGGGNLSKPWNKRKVICFEINKGKDFFDCSEKISCDLVLCNPPFSKRAENNRAINQVLPFLEQILSVVEDGTPIVLIVPSTFRLDNRVTSTRLQWLRDSCPPITSIISLTRDTFDATDLHGEILIFNLPKLNPHYFLSAECLRQLRQASNQRPLIGTINKAC